MGLDYRALLFYDNKSDGDGVVLSGGSWALPLSNLKDPRPSKKARSVNAGSTSTRFNVYLGPVATFRGLHLTNTNLSPSALYRITWFADDFVTASGDTGWVGIPGYPADDPDDIGVSIFHLFTDSVAARYWTFELKDEGNAVGFVEIGRLCMMDCWQPPYNFGENNAEGAEPNTQRQNSLGGVGYFNRRKPARYFSFAFGQLPSEQIPTLRRIRKICNIDRQIVVIPDPTDTANFNDRCFLATLKQMPELQLLVIADASIGFQATEVLG